MGLIKTGMGPQRPASILQKPVRGPQKDIRASLGSQRQKLGNQMSVCLEAGLGPRDQLRPSETRSSESSAGPSETNMGLTGQHGASEVSVGLGS